MQTIRSIGVQYATHFSEYGKGGWHEVATQADLANIPTQRLSEGMAARVISENKTYIYTKQQDDTYAWLQDTIDIDEELSSTSTNPVQNKAVQAALAATQTAILQAVSTAVQDAAEMNKQAYSARFEQNTDTDNSYTLVLPMVAGVEGTTQTITV